MKRVSEFDAAALGGPDDIKLAPSLRAARSNHPALLLLPLLRSHRSLLRAVHIALMLVTLIA
ncbi:MAG TPA: hypothetical protein VE842_04685, partial [Pyrinomonadaceae bacterium]|nr:hypothetical protein [Pyrinomonadaceae bacterium]